MIKTESVSVTVAIPTLNRHKSFSFLINQLVNQEYLNFEILVIDQSDEYESSLNKSLIEKMDDPRIKYYSVRIKNLPSARNVAVKNMSGEIIIFLDDDVILLSNNFITQHVLCFSNPEIGAVTGRHVERYMISNTKKTKCSISIGGRTIFNLFGLEQKFLDSCKGSNMSFRKNVFSECGGFDRNTNQLEEADFSYRIRKKGWKILFEPNAEVIHLAIPSGGVRSSSFKTREARRFHSTAYFVLKHRGLLGCVPFIFVFSMIAIKLFCTYRSFGNFRLLYTSMIDGFKVARQGADEEI